MFNSNGTTTNEIGICYIQAIDHFDALKVFGENSNLAGNPHSINKLISIAEIKEVVFSSLGFIKAVKEIELME